MAIDGLMEVILGATEIFKLLIELQDSRTRPSVSFQKSPPTAGPCQTSTNVADLRLLHLEIDFGQGTSLLRNGQKSLADDDFACILVCVSHFLLLYVGID